MSALLKAELLKLRTTRTFVAMVGSALALSLLVVTLVTTLSNDMDKADVRDLFTADFTGLFITLLGVIGMAGEWRHRTITSTVLAAPDRIKLLSAKVISYAAAGAVLSLIVTLTIMLVGTLILSLRGETTAETADLADVLWRNLLTATLLGGMGVGIGGVLRNQVVAIIGVLVTALFLEGILFSLVPDVGKFGPLSSAPSGIAQTPGFDGEEVEHILDPVPAVLVMLAWIGLFYAGAAARLRGSDLV